MFPRVDESCICQCPAVPVGMFFFACVPCWTKVVARGHPALNTVTYRHCKSKPESPSQVLKEIGVLYPSVAQCLVKFKMALSYRECIRTVTGQQAAPEEVIGQWSDQPTDSAIRR